MQRTALLLLGATATLVSACSSGDEPRYHDVGPGRFGRGGGGDAEDRRGALNVFISPAGKPYRAGPGEPYPVVAWFAAADTDHDGKLTLAEFRKDAEAFFRELDTNHDGIVDGFEVQAYEQKIAPEILPRVEGLAAGEGMDLSLGKNRGSRDGPDIGAPRGRRGGGGQGRAGDRVAQGAGLYGLLNEPEPVASSDVRFEGKIRPEDFITAADRRFAALDGAKHGYLTLADLPKTPAQEVVERMAAERAKRAAKP
jgi:hypothetical protein